MIDMEIARGPEYAEVLQVGDVSFSGNGCPEEAENEFTLTADGFGIVLGEMNLYLHASASPIQAQSSCRIQAKLNIPAGKQFAVESIGRQFNISVDGAETIVRSRIDFASSPSVVWTQTDSVIYPIEEQLVSHGFLIDQESLVWSACGGEETLHVREHLQLRRLKDVPKEEATGFIESYNCFSDNPIAYKLIWRDCGK